MIHNGFLVFTPKLITRYFGIEYNKKLVTIY